jgi:hypothetical protein
MLRFCFGLQALHVTVTRRIVSTPSLEILMKTSIFLILTCYYISKVTNNSMCQQPPSCLHRNYAREEYAKLSDTFSSHDRSWVCKPNTSFNPQRTLAFAQALFVHYV